jgi:hypothetical protein
MIERIVVLLKIVSKMSDSLYMLSARIEVISLDTQLFLITSRNYNHITWFCCNFVSVSSFATFSHRTWVVNDFSSSQLLQKQSKLSDFILWKVFYKRKFFFLTHLLYAKSTFNSDRKLYKKRWCDHMRTRFSFHRKTNSLFSFHRLLSRKKEKKRW